MIGLHRIKGKTNALLISAKPLLSPLEKPLGVVRAARMDLVYPRPIHRMMSPASSESAHLFGEAPHALDFSHPALLRCNLFYQEEVKNPEHKRADNVSGIVGSVAGPASGADHSATNEASPIWIGGFNHQLQQDARTFCNLLSMCQN